MTNAQQTAKEINRILGEFSEGFLFVGFHPETKEPITCVSVPDGKTEVALNSIVGGILQVGGVGAVLNQIKKAEKAAEKRRKKEEE